MRRGSRKIFITKLAIFLLVNFLVSPFSADVFAQRKRAKLYNDFAHNIAAHRKQSCNSCHKSPTGLSSDETADGADYKFPDITDYPTHDSCINCHRQQFFRGAKPAICSICHVKVSPRDAARFPFEKPNQKSEFAVEFSHETHQDIIAGNLENSPLRDGAAAAHFVNAKFTFPDDDKKTEYNNCAICHAPAKAKTYDTTAREPRLVALETGLIAPAHTEKINAPSGYFKTLPEGHASCFNCHYSEQKPTRIDCAGCHISSSKPVADSNVVERLSLKFNHDQKTENGTNPHDKECSACHVRITQSADLRSLNPDVPIFACSAKGNGCHSDEIKGEVDRRGEDLLARQANAQHKIQNCSYCHSSYVGSFQVPESHKLIKP